jgi:exodeoxyribonuclease V alpha subunit
VRVQVLYLVFYDYLTARELEHCYAITVHKSQGSEFDYCIIPIVSVSPMLMTRNLLYTAITRAKKLTVILGTTENLKTMIDNDSEVLRYTGLFKTGEEEVQDDW